VAAVALVAWTGFEAGFGRLLATSAPDASAGARFAAAARTGELLTRFPVCGVGLGAFLAAFPLVQGAGLPGTWRHAHDDWLELAATTGVLGTLLFAAGLAAGLAGLRQAWRRARRSEDRAAVVAASGALAAAGLHSLTDFGMTLPANALTLALLAGAALAVGDVENVRPEAAAGGDRAAAQPPAETADQLDEEPASKPSANSG
jgi:O-antigen ligase